MIKKKLQRGLAMGLAAFMLTSLFAGCQKSGNPGSQSAATATQVQTPGEAAPTGYPITTSPIKLQYWVSLPAVAAQYIRSFDENEAFVELQKRTGIEIEFIHPAAGQEMESLQMAVAAKNIPDIIEGSRRYTGGEFKGLEDGVFANLTDLIPQYAPDYYQYLTADEAAMRVVTNDDGKMVAIYRIAVEDNSPARRAIIRKDWLDELGLEIPKTIEDYENVFRTIKEAKGIAPYNLNFDGVEEQFVGAFGIFAGFTAAAGNATENGFFMRDGKTISFGKIQPEFKEYLELMNRWYKAGYISKDFVGLKRQQVQNQFDSGKIALFFDPIVANYNRAKQLGIKVSSAPYPRKNLGDKLHWDDMNIVKTSNPVSISADSNFIPEAIRLLNYGYTDEGALLFNYGLEGKAYKLENGKPQFTDYILKNEKFGTEPANYILKIHLGATLGYSDEKVNPNLIVSPDSLAIRSEYANDPDVDDSIRVPTLNNLTADELSKTTTIMTQVNTYCDEMILKFIMGVEPLSNYDTYVQAVQKLGIDDAIATMQAAYDRYMSK